MEDIHIIPVVSEQLAPLYERHSNNLTSCRAVMALSSSGQVNFRVDVQGGDTFDVYYGRTRTWDIPPELTSDELKIFGERLKELLSQVHRGLCLSWDTNQCEERGALTREAQEASDKIQDECDRLFEMVKGYEIGVYMIEPSDYFDNESPEDYGLNADASDDEIRKEAVELLEHFNSINSMIYGDMFEMVKEWVRDYEHYGE